MRHVRGQALYEHVGKCDGVYMADANCQLNKPTYANEHYLLPVTISLFILRSVSIYSTISVPPTISTIQG